MSNLKWNPATTNEEFVQGYDGGDPLSPDVIEGLINQDLPRCEANKGARAAWFKICTDVIVKGGTTLRDVWDRFDQILAERADQEEEEKMRRRMYDFPKPPTRLEMQPNGTYKEVDARDPDDISPGFSHTGALLPSRNELKARQQRREAEARKLREQEEQEEKERREEQALREVRRKYEEEAVISVGGIRCHPDGRIVG